MLVHTMCVRIDGADTLADPSGNECAVYYKGIYTAHYVRSKLTPSYRKALRRLS